MHKTQAQLGIILDALVHGGANFDGVQYFEYWIELKNLYY